MPWENWFHEKLSVSWSFIATFCASNFALISVIVIGLSTINPRLTIRNHCLENGSRCNKQIIFPICTPPQDKNANRTIGKLNLNRFAFCWTVKRNDVGGIPTRWNENGVFFWRISVCASFILRLNEILHTPTFETWTKKKSN